VISASQQCRKIIEIPSARVPALSGHTTCGLFS
jgi:hypothetical protein